MHVYACSSKVKCPSTPSLLLCVVYFTNPNKTNKQTHTHPGTRWFTEPHPYTMSTMNMQEFQRDNFKPQDWINRELANVKPEALENNVNSLALRLQVLGNEVNTCFEDHIIQSLAKLPMYGLLF